jgi:hypothetical protein
VKTDMLTEATACLVLAPRAMRSLAETLSTDPTVLDIAVSLARIADTQSIGDDIPLKVWTTERKRRAILGAQARIALKELGIDDHRKELDYPADLPAWLVAAQDRDRVVAGAAPRR